MTSSLLCVSSNHPTIHIFKLETAVAPPPAEDASAWSASALFSAAIETASSMLPTPVSDMWTQTRSFAQVGAPRASLCLHRRHRTHSSDVHRTTSPDLTSRRGEPELVCNLRRWARPGACPGCDVRGHPLQIRAGSRRRRRMRKNDTVWPRCPVIRSTRPCVNASSVAALSVSLGCVHETHRRRGFGRYPLCSSATDLIKLSASEAAEAAQVEAATEAAAVAPEREPRGGGAAAPRVATDRSVAPAPLREEEDDASGDDQRERSSSPTD